MEQAPGPRPYQRAYVDGGWIVRLPPRGWRKFVPRWHPRSWLGMAVANRLFEWYSMFSTRVLKRQMIWIPPRGDAPPEAPPHRGVSL